MAISRGIMKEESKRPVPIVVSTSCFTLDKISLILCKIPNSTSAVANAKN